jgi:transcriptional regulator with GAF, ATPase, and Fis domain
MPPLRERRGDIPLLTDAFLQEFNRSTGCSSAGLTPDAREMLVGYEWPGNVRELHNALERAAIGRSSADDHARLKEIPGGPIGRQTRRYPRSSRSRGAALA